MEKTKITITIEQDGQTVAGMTTGEETQENRAAENADFSEREEMTEDEAERYAVASDLANVCEYLEDSEVIKIRLIVSKAQARKERAGEYERGSRRGGRNSRISLYRTGNRLRLLYVSFIIKENTGSRRKAEKADKKI